jgi:hypothetical protein
MKLVLKYYSSVDQNHTLVYKQNALGSGNTVPFHVVPFVSWFMGSFPCGAFCELVHGFLSMWCLL